MARTILGAIWEFVRYEISSRLRGDLVLEFETHALHSPAPEALFRDLMRAFPNARYYGAGDDAGAWKVTVHVPHLGEPNVMRARLVEWATLHRPPVTHHAMGHRRFLGAA